MKKKPLTTIGTALPARKLGSTELLGTQQHSLGHYSLVLKRNSEKPLCISVAFRIMSFYYLVRSFNHSDFLFPSMSNEDKNNAYLPGWLWGWNEILSTVSLSRKILVTGLEFPQQLPQDWAHRQNLLTNSKKIISSQVEPVALDWQPSESRCDQLPNPVITERFEPAGTRYY